MKRLIFYVIILILAVWLGLLLQKDPGYILIVYNKWTAETSLWMGIIFLVIAFFLLHYILRFINLLIKSRGHILRWNREKRFLKAHTHTGAGLLALEEGAWDEAEDLLLRGAKNSNIAVVNYLNAARAAQEQLNYNKRDKYLAQALDLAEGHEKLAVFLTEASLHIEHQQYEAARLSLEKLHADYPRHRYILKLLQQVYLAEGLWEKLFNLIPLLKKRSVLSNDELEKLSTTIYTNLFLQKHLTLEQLQSYWKTLPKNLRHNPTLNYQFIRQLIQLKADNTAQDMLVDALKNDYSIELVELYAQLKIKNQHKAIQHVETWVKKYGERSELLLALAQLHLSNHDYEKAKSYVERALQFTENKEAYLLLAQIHSQLDDEKASCKALMQAYKI